MIDYNWFFSSLVQALAAMIGVIGMFAVYRLQVQGEEIRKACHEVIVYLKDVNGESIEIYNENLVLLRATAFKIAKFKIINEPEENTDRQRKGAQEEIETMDKHIAAIQSQVDRKKNISKEALSLVRGLVLLFGLSVLCLVFAKELTIDAKELVRPDAMKIIYSGYIVLGVILIYLLVSLRKLYIFCNTCFDSKQ
jgi:hypothetical protein